MWPTVAQGKQVSLNKRLLGYHFCQAHDIDSLSLTTFVGGLVDQLSKSELISGYCEKIATSEARKLRRPSEIERNPDEASFPRTRAETFVFH